MTKDTPEAITHLLKVCGCGDGTCRDCMTDAAQLRAWNIKPVAEPQEDRPKKKSKKEKN